MSTVINAALYSNSSFSDILSHTYLMSNCYKDVTESVIMSQEPVTSRYDVFKPYFETSLTLSQPGLARALERP
jgi:hypothetical protein